MNDLTNVSLGHNRAGTKSIPSPFFLFFFFYPPARNFPFGGPTSDVSLYCRSVKLLYTGRRSYSFNRTVQYYDSTGTMINEVQ